MKLAQLIGYNMRNIFVEKWYTKCGREAIPWPFSKKWKLSISLDQYSKVFLYFVLVVCHVEDYWKWLKLSCISFAVTSYKAFLKNKKRSETSLPDLFSAWFLKKNISAVILYSLSKFQCLVDFTSWDNGQYVYCNVIVC